MVKKIWPNMSVLFPRKWNSLKFNGFQHRHSRKIWIRLFFVMEEIKCFLEVCGPYVGYHCSKTFNFILFPTLDRLQQHSQGGERANMPHLQRRGSGRRNASPALRRHLLLQLQGVLPAGKSEDKKDAVSVQSRLETGTCIRLFWHLAHRKLLRFI